MLAQPRTFRCPNCNEMINDSMERCCFCSVPLDPGIVALVSDRQEKANQACSDASYVRTAAIAMFVLLAVSLIPFVPMVYYGFLVTFVIVVVMLVRWRLRFGTLLSSDADFEAAKRSWRFALVLWIAAIPLGFIVRPLVDVVLASLI